MKKLLIIIPVVAIMVGMTLLAVKHRDNYTKQENAKRQVVVDKQEKLIADLTNDKIELVGKYNLNRVECEKGTAAYDLLTTAVKAKTPRPVCGAVVTQ